MLLLIHDQLHGVQSLLSLRRQHGQHKNWPGAIQTSSKLTDTVFPIKRQGLTSGTCALIANVRQVSATVLAAKLSWAV